MRLLAVECSSVPAYEKVLMHKQIEGIVTARKHMKIINDVVCLHSKICSLIEEGM